MSRSMKIAGDEAHVALYRCPLNSLAAKRQVSYPFANRIVSRCVV